MQPGLFFFPLYHTNEAVKDFNVLVTLTVYDGAFPDLDVVNQFLNDFPVKLLHIQIMENFFGLLKSELLYLQEFESMEHFKRNRQRSRRIDMYEIIVSAGT